MAPIGPELNTRMKGLGEMETILTGGQLTAPVQVAPLRLPMPRLRIAGVGIVIAATVLAFGVSQLRSFWQPRLSSDVCC